MDPFSPYDDFSTPPPEDAMPPQPLDSPLAGPPSPPVDPESQDLHDCLHWLQQAASVLEGVMGNGAENFSGGTPPVAYDDEPGRDLAKERSPGAAWEHGYGHGTRGIGRNTLRGIWQTDDFLNDYLQGWDAGAANASSQIGRSSTNNSMYDDENYTPAQTRAHNQWVNEQMRKIEARRGVTRTPPRMQRTAPPQEQTGDYPHRPTMESAYGFAEGGELGPSTGEHMDQWGPHHAPYAEQIPFPGKTDRRIIHSPRAGQKPFVTQPSDARIVSKPRRTGTMTEEQGRRLIESFNPQYSQYGDEGQEYPPQGEAMSHPMSLRTTNVNPYFPGEQDKIAARSNERRGAAQSQWFPPASGEQRWYSQYGQYPDDIYGDFPNQTAWDRERTKNEEFDIHGLDDAWNGNQSGDRGRTQPMDEAVYGDVNDYPSTANGDYDRNNYQYSQYYDPNDPETQRVNQEALEASQADRAHRRSMEEEGRRRAMGGHRDPFKPATSGHGGYVGRADKYAQYADNSWSAGGGEIRHMPIPYDGDAFGGDDYGAESYCAYGDEMRDGVDNMLYQLAEMRHHLDYNSPGSFGGGGHSGQTEVHRYADDHDSMSAHAHELSERARQSGMPEHHSEAATAHFRASDAHQLAGNKSRGFSHALRAHEHINHEESNSSYSQYGDFDDDQAAWESGASSVHPLQQRQTDDLMRKWGFGGAVDQRRGGPLGRTQTPSDARDWENWVAQGGMGNYAAYDQPSDHADLSPHKAREILHDGTVHGHPITDRQRRFFGAVSDRGDYADQTPGEFGYETPMGTFQTWEEAANRVHQSDMDPTTTIRTIRSNPPGITRSPHGQPPNTQRR